MKEEVREVRRSEGTSRRLVYNNNSKLEFLPYIIIKQETTPEDVQFGTYEPAARWSYLAITMGLLTVIHCINSSY